MIGVGGFVYGKDFIFVPAIYFGVAYSFDTAKHIRRSLIKQLY